MAQEFDLYLKELRKIPLADQTEHSARSAMEKLLNAFATKGTLVQHEPKKISGKGAPDFKVTKKGMTSGYVETKAIGENLDKVLKSPQIEKYKILSPNILLTDYLHFIWIRKDGIERESLCHATDLENPKFRLKDDKIEAVAKLLDGFFSTPPQSVARARELALELAKRSRLLRDALDESLITQEKEGGKDKLYGLFQVFKTQVFHELTLKEFADAFAQMLAYGLFLAKLSAGNKIITLSNAREFVPGSFKLIQELVDFLTELEKPDYRDVRWVVVEILSIINGLDLASIHEDLSFRQRKAANSKIRAKDEEEHRLFERDPFIYFYEDYLRAYDKEASKSRGVYYTPPPIVNFIVRAIDDSLKDTFKIKSGLADHKRVTVLDFACGTGTFLLEVFQKIFETIGGPESGLADLIVREHLLKNIYGFEYLIAPYTIAHLKLSHYLEEQERPLKEDERLQVFLTNTLEPIKPQPNFLLPEVSKEVEQAQKIKDQPILVITGNPPYSGHSKNKGEWISTAIDEYKFTFEKDENGQEIKKPLGERNPKWLNDDYVKFIRFAQLKMDVVPEGIVGIITNHSWLDNPTFRGMRQSLMRSFEQIYILDLHGNAKKKEKAPDGSKDENVFDIEQGVAISIFIKRAGLERGIWRGDLWGKRLQKYETATHVTIESVGFEKVNPSSPYYLFLSQDAELQQEYEKGLSIANIMPLNSVGLVTSRDNLAIAFTETEIKERVADFAQRDSEDARQHYHLGPDVQDWGVARAQEDVKKGGKVIPIAYRPFDTRYTFYTGRAGGFHVRPREKIMRHIKDGHIGLITTKNWASVGMDSYDGVTVVSDPVEFNYFRRGGEFIFPIFTYSDDKSREKKIENFSTDFRAFVDEKYNHQYSAEEIFGYIYAVLHAKTYRERYAEFLRVDFPRIPFAEEAKSFKELSDLGWKLVEAHLLRNLPDFRLAAYHGKGDHSVEKVQYAPAEKSLWINKIQYFNPIPQEVWDFHIGGYRVIEKYLKSRKERELSLDEINHVSAIANCLFFTLDYMEKIDKAYREAFS